LLRTFSYLLLNEGYEVEVRKSQSGRTWPQLKYSAVNAEDYEAQFIPVKKSGLSTLRCEVMHVR
jgi:hypothetical protein